MNRRQVFNEEYFTGGLSNYRGYLRDHRFPRVARALTEIFKLKGRRVLDAGCAVPYLVDELNRLGVIAVGFDISDYCVKKTVEEKLKCFLHADALFIPFKGKAFYCVIASELVEHIPHDLEDQLLNELVRVTQKYLLIRTPFCHNPDDNDKTHVNIHPHMYWITKIEQYGLQFDFQLFVQYAQRGHREFPLFFDEFLVFRW